MLEEDSILQVRAAYLSLVGAGVELNNLMVTFATNEPYSHTVTWDRALHQFVLYQCVLQCCPGYWLLRRNLLHLG